MSFWDNMTKPKPLVILPEDEKDKVRRENINLIEENKNLRAEIARLRKSYGARKRETHQALDVLMQLTCDYTGLTKDEVLCKIRVRKYVRARCIFALLAEQDGHIYNDIARYLERDHATVFHMRNNNHKHLFEQDYKFLAMDIFEAMAFVTKPKEVTLPPQDTIKALETLTELNYCVNCGAQDCICETPKP